MRCPTCGETWSEERAMCPSCGAPAADPTPVGGGEDPPQKAGGGAGDRRWFLRGLALAGVGAALGVGGYVAARLLTRPPAPAPPPPTLTPTPPPGVVFLTARFVPDPLPVEDPDAPLWDRGEEGRFPLQPQNVTPPFKATPGVASVAVRALHNGREIAFRMEWEDKDRDDLTVKVTQFRDACAVLLGSPTAPWVMGSREDPVTILYWKADWQRDREQGFQEVKAAFPNATFDFYPPLVGVPAPAPKDYPQEVRFYLPALAVGNPLSQPERPSPVEKVQAMGPGTVEPFPTQDARGRGVWRDGRWRVVLARALAARDKGEVALAPGQTYALAVAVWSGAAGDRGARKAISQMGRLHLEPTR